MMVQNIFRRIHVAESSLMTSGTVTFSSVGLSCCNVGNAPSEHEGGVAAVVPEGNGFMAVQLRLFYLTAIQCNTYITRTATLTERNLITKKYFNLIAVHRIILDDQIYH